MSSICPRIVVSSPTNIMDYSQFFMNTKITISILTHLSTQEIINLRQICKSWNKSACLILQSRKLIEFRHVTDIARYLTTFCRNHLPSSTTADDLFLYPYARFYFYKIRLNLIHDNYLLRTFFKKYQSTITHIQMDFTGPQFRLKYLRMCVLENMANIKCVIFTFKDFQQLWPASLSDEAPGPPLKSVQDLTIYGFGREPTLKSVIEKIIPYFPNVTRLEAGETIGRLIFEIVYGDLSDSDSNNGFKSTLRHLAHIDFNYIYPTQLDTIIANDIQLKSLKGGIHMCLENRVTDLLQFLSPNLKMLSLECHSSVLKFATRVCMSALVQLELTKFQLDLGILINFPLLKTLKLKMVQILWEAVEETEGVVNFSNINLTNVTLEICEVNDKNLAGFKKVFNSVRKLDLAFCLFTDMDTFGRICESLVYLEEIHLATGGNKGEDILQDMLGSNLKIIGGDGAHDIDVLENNIIKVFDRESQDYLGALQVIKA